jgi:hypothetical protein
VPNQHNSIIFCVFVLMQLFNQLNARKLHGEVTLHTNTRARARKLHGEVSGLAVGINITCSLAS